jgi:hypothetical protein
LRPCARVASQITTYECSSADFVLHHGEDNARAYLEASRAGIRLQKSLGSRLLPRPGSLCCNGSLYLAAEGEVGHWRLYLCVCV